MTISGTVIFCDDIREEVGGKLSLMGCYRGEIIFDGEPPIIMAKFCTAIHIKMPLNEEIPELKLTIENVEKGLPPLAEMNLEAGPMNGARLQELKRTESENSDSKYLMLALTTVLSPVQFSQPGRITVKIEGNGEQVSIGSIRVVFKSTSRVQT